MSHIPSPDCPCKPKVIDHVGTVTIIHRKVTPKREAK
jgi:hypothetical protein